MPRSHQARLGCDGFEEDVEPFSLQLDDVQHLMALLNPRAEISTADLARALSEYGGRYRRWNNRGPAAFSRAEACKSLAVVMGRPVLDGSGVLRLNSRALDLVWGELLLVSHLYPALIDVSKPRAEDNELDVWSKVEQDVFPEETLRAACGKVQARLKEQTGPDPSLELGDCVFNLCRLYEGFSGRLMTLSNKGEHMAYEVIPTGDAARFVHACFALIDPGLRLPSRLNRHIRAWIENGSEP